MKYIEWLSLWMDNYIKPSTKERTYIRYEQIIYSYIVPDNVISKAKCATRGQQGVLGIVQIEDKQQSDAKCLQSYTRCITQAFASNRRTPTVRLGSRP